MEEAVTKQYAHRNTVFYCLCGYYRLGYARKLLAHIYNKDVNTIGNWIRVYESSGTFERVRSSRASKFSEDQRQWFFNFFQDRPLANIDEAQHAFMRSYQAVISKTSVWRILHEFGLTWTVLERRAMHIKEADVFRFTEELSHIDWSHQNVVFLDDVSFDNRGMLRKRGYAIRGKTLAIRGDFQRKPRVSALAFMGINGIIDYFDTEGTFDRFEFVNCCRDFVFLKRGNVRQYPGPNSVWILDGAVIHRDPEIVHFLRSIGVVPIFLPAYCPFFNPIEYLFGYVKKSFQRHYVESSGRDLTPFVAETFSRFESFNMSKVFEHCGWTVQGFFNPIPQLEKEKRCATDTTDDDRVDNEDETNLGFTVRQFGSYVMLAS